MTDSDQLAFILRIFRCLNDSGMDLGDFWLRAPASEKPFAILLNLNDTFHYATADAEEVTPENVAALEQAVADCKACEDSAFFWSGVLWAARLRKMMPLASGRSPGMPKLNALFDASVGGAR